jgi:hypothetical protein
MTAMRWVLLVVFVGFGIHWWMQRSEERSMRVAMDEYGFLPVPMPNGAQANQVLLFAPLNCPREGAQRANALADRLSAAGIPNLRTAEYRLQGAAATADLRNAVKRLSFVMTGEIPIALVNGMGRANPTAEEIIAEYNKTR